MMCRSCAFHFNRIFQLSCVPSVLRAILCMSQGACQVSRRALRMWRSRIVLQAVCQVLYDKSVSG